MSFVFDHWQLANMTIARMAGEPAAGRYRLLVDISFNLPAYPREQTYRVIQLGGELSVRDGNSGQRYLGRMYPVKGSLFLETSAVATQSETTFGVDLGRAALEAIERIRMGGGVSFTMALHGIALGETGFRQVTSQRDHAVNQGTWVEILNQFGYKKLMLIEIPVPDPAQSPKLSKAVSYLSDALNATMEGRCRNAVASCRDVLESLSAALEDQDEKDPDVQALFENTRSMDKERRYRVVRRAMKVLTNPAHHPDALVDQSGWDHLDALSVVTMAAALLRRFAGVAEGR